MPTLSVQLFGKFCVTGALHAQDLLTSTKVQELFCYLLVFRDRSHHREALANLLWGNNPTAQSKKYLRQTLWQLQTSLSTAPEAPTAQAHADCPDCSLLAVEPDWVAVNTQADMSLDLAAFENAFALVQGVRGRELDPDKSSLLQNAVELYRGDLLEGWYQDWCLFERERLQNEYLLMLDKLMGYCEATNRFDDGFRYGDMILRVDRAQERTHQRLMRLYYRSGHRAAALRQYQRCVSALNEELGVPPAQATGDLYHQICADQLDTSQSAPVQMVKPDFSRAGLIAHLVHIQNGLTELQRQVERDIQELRSKD